MFLFVGGIPESAMRAQVAGAIPMAEGFSRGAGGADLAVVNNDVRLPCANPAAVNAAGLAGVGWGPLLLDRATGAAIVTPDAIAAAASPRG